MKLAIGIVGLPNVGKSTLFNALLKKQQALAANYPFATIEPNVGVVEVPDERLPILAKIVNTQKIVPAIIEFYDIAGLVKGASQGEGLGNKFLSHIREVAAIVHVVRLFEDSDIIHVSNVIDPLSDMQTIEMELILADLETLKKQRKPKQNSEKEEKLTYEIVQILIKELNEGKPARKVSLNDEHKVLIKQLNLMTMKPNIFVFNISEKQLENKEETEKKIDEFVKKTSHVIASNISLSLRGSKTTEAISSNGIATSSDFVESPRNDEASQTYIYLNAKLENEILAFPEEEQKEYLKQYSLEDTGLNRLIEKAYETLGLISFLTAGEKEVRAWTIEKGMFAPQAAGVIHTDFEKHFIKADIVPYPLFVEANGWVKAREQGKVQTTGKDYVMKDGDVVEFKVGI